MIALIFATDPNHLIGKDNALPWYYPEDLAYFKKTTLNQTVLMGRKTFESIIQRNGKPLPKRHNIVVSRHGFEYPGVTVVKDLVGFLEQPHEEDIFVIGGKAVYETAFPYATKLYITWIKRPHEGDTHLNFTLEGFRRIASDPHLDLVFEVYERI